MDLKEVAPNQADVDDAPPPAPKEPHETGPNNADAGDARPSSSASPPTKP